MGYLPKGHIRNEAVEALKAGCISDWIQQHYYGKRSLAETAMYRYKQLIGLTLTLRDQMSKLAKPLPQLRL